MDILYWGNLNFAESYTHTVFLFQGIQWCRHRFPHFTTTIKYNRWRQCSTSAKDPIQLFILPEGPHIIAGHTGMILHLAILVIDNIFTYIYTS